MLEAVRVLESMERRQQHDSARAGKIAERTAAIPAGAMFLCCLFGACRMMHGALPSPAYEPNPREAAESAMEMGNWALAAERWYALFLQDRNAVEPCAMTARSLLHTKDADSASHVLDIGLAKHPDDPDLCELKGDALVELGFRRPAEEYYLRALKADANRVSVLLSLASLRMDLGWETAAIAPLEQAVAIKGGDAASWYMLARARRAAANSCGAFEAYAKSLALQEGSVDDLVSAATLPINDALRRAHPEAPQTMLSWLERAAARDPQCTKAHFMMGVLSEELGKKDDAIAHYRRSVETDPGCLMSLRNLAVLYASLGDEANTREIVGRALQLEKDQDRRHGLQRLLDTVHDARGNKTAAESHVPQQP
jgi:tetratricopeptide (TPR) repeat protein